MGKKEDREKKLLREILEEEELLIDRPDKKTVQDGKSTPVVKQERVARNSTPQLKKTIPVKSSAENVQKLRPTQTSAPIPQKKEATPTKSHQKTSPSQKLLTKAIIPVPKVIPPPPKKSAKKTVVIGEDDVKELLEDKVEKQFIPGMAKPVRDEPVTIEQHEIMPYRSKEDPSHAEALQEALDNYPRVHRRRLIRFSVILLIVGLVLIFTVFKTDLIETGYNMTLNRDHAPPIVQNVSTKVVEEKISFSVLSGTTGPVTVTGFLKYSVVQVPNVKVSMHIFSIVDDYGNEIRLYKLTTQQQRLFSLGNTTTSLYEVSGTLGRSNGVLELKVDSIKLGHRSTKVAQVS
jgi:hypothetical protein